MGAILGFLSGLFFGLMIWDNERYIRKIKEHQIKDMENDLKFWQEYSRNLEKKKSY